MTTVVVLTEQEKAFLVYSMRRGCRALEKQREELTKKFGAEADLASVNAKLDLALAIREKLRG